ncbi:MAG: hypothetical protein ACYS8W_20370, partial [Planctomycetota bacterium]
TDSKWLIYTHRVNDIELKVIAYFLTAGRKGYAFTGTARPGTFDSYRPVFDKIVKSLRIE